MTARLWPADSVDTNADGILDTPSYTGRWLRQTAVAAATSMGSATRPLGAVSGVRPGTPGTIATATSTTWTVTPFMGVLDGEAAAIAGAYAYSFDANVTGSVTAAGASARTDRLDVQVSDAAESDGTGATTPPNVNIVYTVGAPGLQAAPPRSHPLAQINVPATGGGSPTVTWTASYFAAAGGMVPFNLLAGLTAWVPPTDGQLAYAMDTDNLWEYVPGATTPGWYHVAGRPVAGAFTPTGIYANGGIALETRGGWTGLAGTVTSSSATFVVGNSYTLGSIPASFAPSTNQVFACIANTTDLGCVTVTSAGSVSLQINTTFGPAALNLSLSGCTWRTKGLT